MPTKETSAKKKRRIRYLQERSVNISLHATNVNVSATSEITPLSVPVQPRTSISFVHSKSKVKSKCKTVNVNKSKQPSVVKLQATAHSRHMASRSSRPIVRKLICTQHCQTSVSNEILRSYLQSNIRMREIKRKMFDSRVIQNLMQNQKKSRGRYLQFLYKMQTQSLVKEAMQMKNKLFGKVVSKLKPLDNMIKGLAANCYVSKTLTPANFCTLIGGKWQHTSVTERYFHDEMYHPASAIPLAVDASGRCFQYADGVLIDQEQMQTVQTSSQTQSGITTKTKPVKYTWLCTEKCNVRKESCKILRSFIMSYNTKKNYTTKIKILAEMDKCPIRTFSGIFGHSLACLERGVCPSVLHHIRMIASHHTIIRNLVTILYRARNPIHLLQELNTCLVSGTPDCLKILIQRIREIYFNTEQEVAIPIVGEGLECNVLSEHYLLTTFGPQMAKFDAESSLMPNEVCVDCKRMCYKAQVKYVDVLEKIDEPLHVLSQLALYLIIEDVHDVQKLVTICTYCLRILKMNKVPPRSVLNGMDLDCIPESMQKLNPFEIIALQTLHPFQVIVRLQTKSGRFAAKELAKGMKGKVIYLPLDLKKNVLTLGIEEQPLEPLFILVNGVPTKDHRIWQQIVDVQKLRTALLYLKENNVHYSDVEVESFIQQNTIPGIDTQTRGQFTQVPAQERQELFDHFTVYRINPQEEAGDSLELFQMKKTKSAPISLYEKTVEARCFPNLLPTGNGGRLDDRNIRISATEYRTSRMYCIDRRFATHPEYIFHLFFESEFSAVCQAVKHTFKTGARFSNITAEHFIQNVKEHTEIMENSVTNIFGTVRATKQYWARRYSEVCCMLRHLGPPTWFVTLSCAEFGWEDLLTFIRDTHKGLPGIQNMSPAQLCAFEPVLVNRFFDQRFRAMFHFICNKKVPPLGLVEHYFFRKEYQARGAPHIHLMLWIKDAPVFGKDSDDKVLDFIHEHVSCAIPSVATNPSLHEKVVKFQIHHCGAYCRRKFYSGGKFYIKCRFAFPRPISPTGKVNSFMSSVRHSVTKKSPKNTYHLKRGLESQYINDYNPAILNMWNANMDVQFVADNATAVARYVTGYITKPEKSQAQDIWLDLAADKSMPQRLMSYGVQMLQNRECGLPECIDLITGSSLYGRSLQVLWLSLGPSHTRKRVLKDLAEIENLAENSPTSTDILRNNMLDTYYPKRSMTLEEKCLFHIVSYFSFRNLTPDESKGRYGMIEGTGCLVRHKKPSLINHMKLSTDTQELREFYFFCLLQLFKPWRHENELLGGQLTYEAAFLSVQEQIQSPELEQFRNTLQKETEQSKQIAQELAQETPENMQSGSQQIRDPLGQPSVQTEVSFAMGEVEGAMQQAAVAMKNVNDLASTLNLGQKAIYDELVQEIILHTAHRLGQQCCSKSHQLLRFISGEAGTGKSFLIRALQQYLIRTTGSNLSCVIAAPTGIAAFNVNGVTLHRLLLLPVEHDNIMDFNKLSPEGAHEIARVLSQVQLIIIDEVSMVSNLMLAHIHLRLQEVLKTPSDVLFGGKHLVVFGDLLQLTPVKGQPVYQMLSSRDAEKGIGSIGFVNLWKSFHYHELTENMRQAEDLEYAKILQGVRLGIITKQVYQILQSRLLSNMCTPKCTGPEMMQKLIMAKTPCVALMPTVADCDQFNETMIQSENQPLVYLKSIDSIVGENLPLEFNQKVATRLQQLETSVSHTAGLEKTLILCKQCRVMLRRNIIVEQGLVNGAMGIVLGFISDEKTGSISYVLIKFDNCDEPTLIGRIFAQFKLFRNIFIKRLQFPLCAAYAITIHKSQGLSLDTVLIDIGNKLFIDAMAYVALSRVKRLSGLYIIHLNESKITADRNAVIEYNRLRALYASHLGLYLLPAQKTQKRQWNQVSTVGSETCQPAKKRAKSKHVQFADVVPPVHSDQQLLISGFSNSTGVECYCNSSLQLLFEIGGIIEDIVKSPTALLSATIGELFQQRQQRQPAVLHAHLVRQIAADKSNLLHFHHQEQQDCQEFIMTLFNVLNNEGIEIDNFIEISYTWTHVCLQCKQSNPEHVPSERFLFLPIPDIPLVQFKNLTVKANHENSCSHCGNTMQSTLTTLSVKKYVLLVLTRYRANGIKLNTNIQEFRHGQVSLSKKNFKTCAIIFHEGQTTGGGHYTVWLRRSTNWLVCNDTHITTSVKLPPQLHNAYIVLLQKT